MCSVLARMTSTLNSFGCFLRTCPLAPKSSLLKTSVLRKSERGGDWHMARVENLTWRLRNIWSKNGQEISLKLLLILYDIYYIIYIIIYITIHILHYICYYVLYYMVA